MAGFYPVGFSWRFRFLRSAPGGFVVGASPSLVGLWFGVGLGPSTGGRWAQHQADLGRNQDEPTEPGDPGRGVFYTALSGVGFFGGFLRGSLYTAVSFSAFHPWRVWCWAPSFRGRSVVSRWVGVPVLIPTVGCWAPTPTRPASKQKRTRQPGEETTPTRSRLMSALVGGSGTSSYPSIRGWLAWRLPSFLPGGLLMWFRLGSIPWESLAAVSSVWVSPPLGLAIGSKSTLDPS